MGHIMTKGVFKLQEILELQKKIVPELVNTLEKRYNVLRTIYHNEPIGRRSLAEKLNTGERTVRTEIGFLKEQELIEINPAGLKVNDDGEEIINKLKDFIHEIKKIIQEENKSKPLSDQSISLILKENNIKISRRTVAKYREELGIKSSSMRKRL